METAVSVLHAGIPIAKMEFLDERSIEATNIHNKLDLPVSPTLFLEFSGSLQSVEEQATIVSEF